MRLDIRLETYKKGVMDTSEVVNVATSETAKAVIVSELERVRNLLGDNASPTYWNKKPIPANGIGTYCKVFDIKNDFQYTFKAWKRNA